MQHGTCAVDGSDEAGAGGADLMGADLMGMVAAARDAAADDPFANPALAVALAISRRLDDGALDLPGLRRALAAMGRDAFADRAARLARSVGGTEIGAPDAALTAVAMRVARPDPDDSPVRFADFRAACERPRAAAVFTAHPTFSLPRRTSAALAEAACGAAIPDDLTFRPSAPDLAEEFDQATAAMMNGRDALDRLAASFLGVARGIWPDRWAALRPQPVILSSWVGYDTDGRTDIGWQDSLRLRLRMKELALARLAAGMEALPDPVAAPLRARLATALDAVRAQVAACPPPSIGPGMPDAGAARAFAQALIGRREEAMTTPAPLLPLFEAAIAAAEDERARLVLAVARAGLVAHGLSLAHTHVRLNATQLHNAVRLRVPALAPDDPARRRALFTAINAALDEVRAEPVDFGGLLTESASAMRLMMTVAQIAKHVDSSQPVRFLVAETESGFTLLAALLLARICGAEGHVEISPLFETAEALEQRGERVLEEALRSPHWRAYLRSVGRLCLQFGYSDSGRYVGQPAASHLIERLKLRVADLLARHGLSGLEVVLFDTHGEGLGRGGHPDGLAARLDYLDPPAVRAAFAAAGTPTRLETSFQGSDGYLLFGTPALAHATVARIAEHAFTPPDPTPDPVYAEGDFAADFFAGMRAGMAALLEDPGYPALLGGFGPALLDRTGSRPAARQSDTGGPVVIRHVPELRAIPNNAVLQQLGFLANLTHGLGGGAAREPETFADLLAHSPRFAGAMAFARAGLALSDADVLRGYAGSLDPATWLDRAARTRRPGRAAALTAVARALETQGLGDPVRRVFRRLLEDASSLRRAWPGDVKTGDAPRMSDRLFAVHAVRLALIHRIWLLAVSVPEFSPRHGVTRAALVDRLLRLDVDGAASVLDEVFPAMDPPGAELDFAEPPTPRRGGYAREREGLIEPLRVLFALVREASAVVSLECGAFG
ncbi:phosphoenolpyruvate carboxylase [Roseomonas sp. CCTCC AB2023176]|uniref:phosphoenolpyruvate carboxylase n=1 Tax=Roseomonas sp. CCTCC AB2023176 TaxID=3342640 RepID=UPI0035D86309